jgi:hypothetical protein
LVGFVAAAAWFLPRASRLSIQGGTLEGTLHLAVLLTISAATAALFAVVFGSFSVRYGSGVVAGVLLLFNVLGATYAAWRKDQPIDATVWVEGCAWGVAMAIFATVAGRLLTPGEQARTNH